MTKTAGNDDTGAFEPATGRGMAGGMGGWPLDDIGGLARRLPGIDPASYFDAQAREAFQQSLVRWPVLARLMKLVPPDDVADAVTASVTHDPTQAQQVE